MASPAIFRTVRIIGLLEAIARYVPYMRNGHTVHSYANLWLIAFTHYMTIGGRVDLTYNQRDLWSLLLTHWYLLGRSRWFGYKAGTSYVWREHARLR